MSLITGYFEKERNRPSDINEHFDTIKKFASNSETIVEMGVRSIVSTWALLAGLPKKMTSIDIEDPSVYGGNIDTVYLACKESGIDFKFVKESSLKLSIEETDLLFIDTLHEYAQLRAELAIHGNKVKKYIIMHDTEHCDKELNPAIEEFLSNNPCWIKQEVHVNNNGLTVLARK